MDKIEEIRRRLHQGKTTREIAKELRVSLRDIHEVRKAEEIDFGALQRKENRLKASMSEMEKALARLDREMLTKQKSLENIENRISEKQKVLSDLDDEISKKRKQVVELPIGRVVLIPQNYYEVDKFLSTLGVEELRWLWRRVSDRCIKSAGEKLDDAFKELVYAKLREKERKVKDGIKLIRGSGF